jgi:hypothetical protein
MLPSIPEQQLAKAVADLVHKERLRDAAQMFADFCKIKIKLGDDNPTKVIPLLQNYLHFLLDNGGITEAAQILWTPTQFNPNPKSVKQIWDVFETSTTGLFMGAGSMGKSFNVGVRLFLEWVRDPQWTTIKVVGPNEDHLEQNLFSHLVGLHQKATLPMPGEIGELFIGIDRRNQYSAIKGVIIPVGQKKKAGRLQGAKRIPRDTPHEVFGPLSRLFIFIDEIENVPGGLWSDIDNVLSNIDGENDGNGLKIFGAFNPTNQTDEVGKRVEPVFGWENFNIDEHFRWKSIRGWEVLRLDGEQSENVKEGKLVYPGLQTRAGLETIARNAGGRNSAGYYSMGRGAYPPTGVEMTLIPPGMFEKARGEYVWYNSPQPAAGCDLALEGGANCVFTIGKYGLVSGIKWPPSLEHPQGETVMFKNRMGQVEPRWGCQAEQQFILPKGDSVVMAEQIENLCKKAGVKPENLALDRTGHGQGVADYLKHDWSEAIIALNFSESCGDVRILVEDTNTCAELYDRVHSELWFATRAYMEYQYVLLAPSMVIENLKQQLTQRKYRPSGKKSKIESKKDYISRGFKSPDDADSFTLFVHACRKGSGVSLSMTGGAVGSPSDEDGYWYNEAGLRGGAHIDSTNRTDYLEGE